MPNATGYEYLKYDAENRLMRTVNVTGNGGRLIGCGGFVGQVTPTDRLGSVGGLSKYYPCGQERETTPQEADALAEYLKNQGFTVSSWTGAMHRDDVGGR